MRLFNTDKRADKKRYSPGKTTEREREGVLDLRINLKPKHLKINIDKQTNVHMKKFDWLIFYGMPTHIGLFYT